MKMAFISMALLWLGGSPMTDTAVSAADHVAIPQKPAEGFVRLAAAQPKARVLPYDVADPKEVMEHVDRVLTDLEGMTARAGRARCDVVAFPEDTLGLGRWEAAHDAELKQVLPAAVARMLERLGRAAAAHRMYLVCCNDTIQPDGSYRNTAFFLGRDGRLVGSYDKVNMPIHELNKQRGNRFPVFPTPEFGGVGMLICYDMVFPEAARCLALGGADIIFHPTLGGAAIGNEEVSRAAFRTRAVENFVYLVVAQRGSGSMIISPGGKIIAEAPGPDEFAIADVNPFAGREGGDSMNHQKDMRARLFRERSPAAFSILTDMNPPVLEKVPATITIQEAVEISAKALTRGEEEFKQADRLAREGKTNEAIRAYERLQSTYRQTWIDRVAGERLTTMQSKALQPRP